MRFKCWAACFKRRDFTQAVGKETKRPLSRNFCIELAHRACCGIARVHKGFLTFHTRCNLAPLALIHRFKLIAPHIHFAAHFQHGRAIADQLQRDLIHRADVVRHVFARFAIAARGRLHEDAVFITQAHGKAIKLQLGNILN